MEQGGSADGILQVRADRIQSDLDELMKALTERCKKYGLQINSTALFELPVGWNTGIQERTADWDEDWDKFEDEGFSFIKEFNHDVQNGVASSKSQYTSVWVEEGSSNGKSEKPLHTGEHALESESTYAHSEDDLERSLPSSPAGRYVPASPSGEFSVNHFGKSTDRDAETHGSFDESAWGNFDMANFRFLGFVCYIYLTAAQTWQRTSHVLQLQNLLHTLGVIGYEGPLSLKQPLLQQLFSFDF